MLHLIKNASGVSDLGQLQRHQSGVAFHSGVVTHATRNMPTRREELLDGGSIYWLVKHHTLARQRLLDMVPGVRGDGSKCAVLVLDPELVPVRSRKVGYMQGWRYLEPADAPADAADGMAEGEGELPAAMRRELERMGLL